MEGVVRAVRSGLVLRPFDPGAAAWLLDSVPYILHRPCEAEVFLIKALKLYIHQLSLLWFSRHNLPSLCVPQYARTSHIPVRGYSPKFAGTEFSEVRALTLCSRAHTSPDARSRLPSLANLGGADEARPTERGVSPWPRP